MEFDGEDSGIVYQQNGTFRIVVTNNGPEAAGTNSTLSTPITVFSGFVELAADGTEMNYGLDPNVTQECGFGLIAVDPRPGDPPGFVFVFRSPVIQPNSSITCHGIYSINFPLGTRTYQWNVNGHIDDTDPNSSNNIFPVTFGVAPVPVPTSNHFGLLILFFTFLVFGITKLKS